MEWREWIWYWEYIFDAMRNHQRDKNLCTYIFQRLLVSTQQLYFLFTYYDFISIKL